jgi:DNA-binding NarL/FixJ family response regulator
MDALEKTPQEAIHSIRKVRTLIADDSPFGLKALAQILEMEGRFTIVGTATDGCQAIRQVFNMQPELVLMDYLMPHVNGIEAARRIKQFENPPRIIIVTSDDTPHSRALAKAAGADGFADKCGDLQGQLRLLFQELFQFAEGNLHGPEEAQSDERNGK